MTIKQIATLYFNGSYYTAAQRLLKLEKAKYIKSYINPTIGLKALYTRKKPSYHRLVVNEIKIVLRGKYSFISDTDYKLGKTRVDCILMLHSKKMVIFEVDIFNRTSQTKINYINDLLAANNATADIWIVTPTTSKRKITGCKIIEIKKLTGLTTIY